MAKDLKANVVLGGRTTAGFDGLAGKIMGLGQVVDMVGSHIREWEKESVETYKNYETYMLEAKGAMSANYESATKLEKAYNGLQQKAQEWAAGSIFHTNDVAKAISEAAHAGWEYNEMMEGIPRAMILAQAGNIDLSSGLDMLIKTINGTGIAFTESGRFVDEWVMAANSGATTVSELGEAMERMGATARFGDSTGELLTMLAVLADTGTVGAQAGTLLRNSMIRLIAPTKAASDTMAGLGVTAEDIQEAVGSDSETLKEVNALLEEVGFSAYTTSGKLKPFLQTFKDLDKATKNMTEEKRNKVLSSIFPTRTITGALALLEAAADNYDGLLERITGSEGYAAQVAKTQTSGLMGKQELFLSKWEEFSRKVGEVLSDPLGRIYEFTGGIVDTLNGMDSVALSGLVGGLSTIASLGPGLMTAGVAMRMFSWIGAKGLIFLGAAIAAGTLLGTLREINQLALENNFGNMSLDMGEIGKALQSSSGELQTALSDLKLFSDEFEKIQQNYQTTGEMLSEGLTSKMIAGTTLTQKDKEKFKQYGEDLIQSVKEGIELATAEKVEFATLIFGDGSGKQGPEDVANNPMWASVITLLDAGASDARDKAAKISEELRKALTSAFEDGKLTDEELQNIQAIIDQINAVMESLDPNNIELNKMRILSQRTSLATMRDFTEQVLSSKEQALAGFDDTLLDTEAALMTAYEVAVKNGLKIKDPNTNQFVDARDVDLQEIMAGVELSATEKRTAYAANWDEALLRGWENSLSTNVETGELYRMASAIIDRAVETGMGYQTAFDQIEALGGDVTLMARSIGEMINLLGGTEAVEKMINDYDSLYQKTGLEVYGRNADRFKRLYALYTGRAGEYGQQSNVGIDTMTDLLADLGDGTAVTADHVRKAYEGLTEAQQKQWDAAADKLTEGLDPQKIMADFGAGGVFDDTVAKWRAAYLIANGKVSNLENYAAPSEEQAQQEALLANVQSKTAELQSAQANLETLRARQETMAANIQERQDWQEHYFSNRARQEAGISDEAYEAYKQKTAELSEEKIKLDADVTAAEEKVTALGTELEALTGEPAALDLDTAQADEKLAALGESKEELGTKPVPIAVDIATAQERLAALGFDIDALGEHKPKVTIDLDSSEVDGWSPPADTYSYHTILIRTKKVGGSGGFMSRFAASLDEFGEGGRAEEASIFGEAGPEWAIPEEHSPRTAELLNAAREASGFSWRELIAQNGGLNAGASSRDVNVTIQSYAPVINARDASGVAEELERDKERLSEIVKRAVRTAIDDMKMMQGIEVYA